MNSNDAAKRATDARLRYDRALAETDTERTVRGYDWSGNAVYADEVDALGGMEGPFGERLLRTLADVRDASERHACTAACLDTSRKVVAGAEGQTQNIGIFVCGAGEYVHVCRRDGLHPRAHIELDGAHESCPFSGITVDGQQFVAYDNDDNIVAVRVDSIGDSAARVSQSGNAVAPIELDALLTNANRAASDAMLARINQQRSASNAEFVRYQRRARKGKSSVVAAQSAARANVAMRLSQLIGVDVGEHAAALAKAAANAAVAHVANQRHAVRRLLTSAADVQRMLMPAALAVLQRLFDTDARTGVYCLQMQCMRAEQMRAVGELCALYRARNWRIDWMAQATECHRIHYATRVIVPHPPDVTPAVLEELARSVCDVWRMVSEVAATPRGTALRVYVMPHSGRVGYFVLGVLYTMATGMRVARAPTAATVAATVASDGGSVTIVRADATLRDYLPELTDLALFDADAWSTKRVTAAIRRARNMLMTLHELCPEVVIEASPMSATYQRRQRAAETYVDYHQDTEQLYYTGTPQTIAGLGGDPADNRKRSRNPDTFLTSLLDSHATRTALLLKRFLPLTRRRNQRRVRRIEMRQQRDAGTPAPE